LRPIGALGELFAGGDGLARGYLAQPALTAERFVPDPFGEMPGGRMYRTGDRVRWRADGALLFAGRADHQVKLRGYRIEPGEIEALLVARPEIAQAVVVPRGRPEQELRLVAYLVAEGGSAIEVTALRAALEATLPRYMVPSAFVVLDALPLTANAKIDRAALPEPSRERGAEPGFLAPRSRDEWLLARIWEELLDVAPVGLDDDFFALGGHSLLAIRLRARVRQVLGRELTLHEVLDDPTVRGMARALGREAQATQGPSDLLVPFRTSGSRPPLFSVHAAGGHGFAFHALARALDAELPFYALKAADFDHPERLGHDRIEAMASAYLEAVRTVQPAGPVSLAGWSFGGVVAYEMARQLGPSGVRALILIDPPIPGSRGTVARASGRALRRSFARELGLAVPARGADGLDELLRRAVEAGTVPAALTLDELARLYGIFERHVRALVAYRPQPAPCEAVWIEPTEGNRVARRTYWQAQAGAGCAVAVPGDHFTMVRAPHVTTLAAVVGQQLEAADQESAA
jgi:thioesterase domain-containing protein